MAENPWNTPNDSPFDIDFWLDSLWDLSTEDLNIQAHNTCKWIWTEEIKQEYENIRTKSIEEYFEFSEETKREISQLLIEIEGIKKQENIQAEEESEIQNENEKDNEIHTTSPEKYQSEYSIIHESNNSIVTEAWEISWLDSEEIVAAKNNPEALDNLVNFYAFFKEINLPWVFHYRQEFITAAWTKDINIADNSISKQELTLLGIKLINLINNLKWPDEEKLVQVSSFEWMKAELKKYSEAGSNITDGKTHGLNGEWKLVNELRNKWFIWWEPPFKTLEIWEMMNKI